MAVKDLIRTCREALGPEPGREPRSAAHGL